jgi:hypothetical protein
MRLYNAIGRICRSSAAAARSLRDIKAKEYSRTYVIGNIWGQAFPTKSCLLHGLRGHLTPENIFIVNIYSFGQLTGAFQSIIEEN